MVSRNCSGLGLVISDMAFIRFVMWNRKFTRPGKPVSRSSVSFSTTPLEILPVYTKHDGECITQPHRLIIDIKDEVFRS